MTGGETSSRPTLRGHLAICRVDHWFKNVFVLPGVVVALSLDPSRLGWDRLPELLTDLAIGMLATCLIASSNYVLNEILDAPYDRLHPIKHTRPVPAGLVHIPLGYGQWLVLLGVGLALAAYVGSGLVWTLLVLWVMGCLYNIPPVRTKDVPYLDVVSEAVNNPIRMLAGWFMADTGLFPPISLLVSYWMVGCFFMAIKRFAEYRTIRNVRQWIYAGETRSRRAAAYRRSFGFYTEGRLLVSVMFYAAAAMLFFGAFIMRYRLELVLSFPFVALMMAVYQALAFREDSPVQTPEALYREPLLMLVVFCCVTTMGTLLFLDLPILHQVFAPTAPTNVTR